MVTICLGIVNLITCNWLFNACKVILMGFSLRNLCSVIFPFFMTPFVHSRALFVLTLFCYTQLVLGGRFVFLSFLITDPGQFISCPPSSVHPGMGSNERWLLSSFWLHFQLLWSCKSSWVNWGWGSSLWGCHFSNLNRAIYVSKCWVIQGTICLPWQFFCSGGFRENTNPS